jgi:predicted GIY-YIG superfamily endonuclease
MAQQPNIYVLKLTSNKYYIGKSSDVEKRYEEHKSGTGSSWTKLYKPTSIIEVRKSSSGFDEDKITKEYMAKYGIKNVRGGSYVSKELDDLQVYNLKREIWSANDCCTEFGRKGHFARYCKATIDVDGDEIGELVWQCDHCSAEFTSESSCSSHEKYCCKNKLSKSYTSKSSGECFRCGRYGHYASSCYASSDKYGNYLDSDEDD